MFMDFTDLNKAFLKDNHPLPKLNKLMDTMDGHAMLSFIDTFSKYHQISIHQGDEEKMAFITHWGLYCYKVMPFELNISKAKHQ